MIDAQRQALALLQREDGQIVVDDVIDAARDEASPLHSAFTWDDAEAAHQHRRDQARALLKRYHFEISVHNVTITVPSYIEAPKPIGSSPAAYVAVDRIQADDRRAAVIRALRQARGSLQSAIDLALFFGEGQELRPALALIDAQINELHGVNMPMAAE